MIYIKNYTIHPTSTFKEELENIIRYIKYNLKETITAKKIYRNIIDELSSLRYFPERNSKIINSNFNGRIIRRKLIKNYVIIYEVDNYKNKVFILHIFHASQNYFNLL